MDRFVADGTAEWDQRQAFHKRLNDSIIMCHNSFLQDNYKNWYKGLSVLYRELRTHAKDDLRVYLDNRFKVLMNAFSSDLVGFKRVELLKILIETQDHLHAIMRSKSFDVPIKEARKGSVLASEGSY
jgi:hypothetical protein